MPRNNQRSSSTSQPNGKENASGPHSPGQNPSPAIHTPRLPCIGSHVEIWWEDRDTAFRGLLHSRASSRKHVFLVHYVDGDRIVTDMDDVYWRFADGKGNHATQQQCPNAVDSQSGWYEPGDISQMLDERRDRNFKVKDKKRLSMGSDSEDSDNCQSESEQNGIETCQSTRRPTRRSLSSASNEPCGQPTKKPHAVNDGLARKRKKLRRLVRLEDCDDESCGTYRSSSPAEPEKGVTHPVDTEAHDICGCECPNSNDGPLHTITRTAIPPADCVGVDDGGESKSLDKIAPRCSAALHDNTIPQELVTQERDVKTTTIAHAKPKRAAHLCLNLAQVEAVGSRQKDSENACAESSDLLSPTGTAAAVHLFDEKGKASEHSAELSVKSEGEKAKESIDSGGKGVSGGESDDGLDEWYESRKATLPHRKRYSMAACVLLLR